MDNQALRIANARVGNPDTEAGIEITWGGFCAEFLASARIAITGADPQPVLNDRHVPCWSGLTVQRGDILKMGYPAIGCRTYLAISGGVDVPLVMGSRSTYVRGGFGGYGGRVLQRGDVIAWRPCESPRSVLECPNILIPEYSDHPTLRITLGPQAESLIPESLDLFLSATYTVTDRCDRMGCSLEGPVLTHRNKADIVSDGTMFGAVQVPGNGLPILLMADRQTIGGYAKPAAVISVDWSLLAQLTPGSTVCFQSVSLWEARELAVSAAYRFQKWITHEPFPILADS
jgi:antagonist of KipI